MHTLVNDPWLLGFICGVVAHAVIYHFLWRR